jgi:Arm DNA-binding domain
VEKMELRAALTERIAAQAKVKGKQYKLADGGGMYLLINSTGSKYWRLNYRFDGKQKTLALGVYPDVSLSEARNGLEQARKLLANGVDPSDIQRVQKQMQKEARIEEGARLKVATRFLLDNEGALSFRFGTRYIALTTAETSDLRTFLEATRTVNPKVTPCP